ncbi:S46 family peptidase [Halostagnicola bangensis]
MPTTRDYEYLLECENVIGVDYDERADSVTVYVSQKVPPDELDPEDEVETRIKDIDGVDIDVEVVDCGYGEERTGFDALSVLEPKPDAAEDRQDRHRPVPAGVSEINAESSAATAGPYPARVEDTSAATWSDDAEDGDLVRLSNNHVYARSNAAELGEPIVQPSPQDGGELDEDEIGELLGYVPIDDGVLVDVAARSVHRDDESTTAFELEESWPTAIRRGDYDDLEGATLTKSGRTTGVTSAELESTNASVRVNFGGEHGPVLFRDQLITGYMSEGGDSGSAVFSDDGELVGLLFGGSSQQTILNKINNVEAELGVELLTDEPESDGESDGNGDLVDEEIPIYTTSFDRTLEFEFVDGDLEPIAITLDELPRSGESVPVTVTVLATDAGEYWLEVNDDRQTFSIEDLEGATNEAVEGEVTATVSVPADEGEGLDIQLQGGRVRRS